MVERFIPDALRRDLHRIEHEARRWVTDVPVVLPRLSPSSDAVRGLVEQALAEERQAVADYGVRAGRARSFMVVDPDCRVCGPAAAEFERIQRDEERHARDLEGLLLR